MRTYDVAIIGGGIGGLMAAYGYSSSPSMTDFEIDGCHKIYACGDGCGITRSLAQAGANGLYISEKILTDISIFQ